MYEAKKDQTRHKNTCRKFMSLNKSNSHCFKKYTHKVRKDKTYEISFNITEMNN